MLSQVSRYPLKSLESSTRGGTGRDGPVVGAGKAREAEIEITPEMIGAGIGAYQAWKPDDFAWQDTEAELVRRIFLAMLLNSRDMDDRGSR